MKGQHVLALVLSMIMVISASPTLTITAQDKPQETSSAIAYISTQLEDASTDRLMVMQSSGIVPKLDSIPLSSVETAVYLDTGNIQVTWNEGGKETAIYTEPDLKRKPHATAQIPKPQTAADDGTDIGLDRLQELVQNSPGSVIVAVLDTGVDTQNELFAGRIVFPYDVVDKDTIPQDDSDHGTHVAGIIAANTPNSVKIMPIRVFDDDGECYDYYLAQAIVYAVKNGAKIINMSVGGQFTTTYLEKAVNYAISKGISVVVSAGNEARDMRHDYPAAFPNVITVGATGRNGEQLFYSSTGKLVDLCAPGEKVISEITQNETESKSGTSMAAPFVAAAAAMLQLEDPKRLPTDIEAILKANTRDLGMYGADSLFGAGEIAFTHYRENDDFYVITSDRENLMQEEKYRLAVRYQAGVDIAALSVMIDGLSIKTESVVGAGSGSMLLDIRSLSSGSHTLTIQPVSRTGRVLPAYQHVFVVPQYNVRIGQYDFQSGGYQPNDPGQQDALIQVLRYNADGGLIDARPIQGVTENGIWMTNIDYERFNAGGYVKLLATGYGKQISTTQQTTTMERPPAFLRTVSGNGEIWFEDSESWNVFIQSNSADTTPWEIRIGDGQPYQELKSIQITPEDYTEGGRRIKGVYFVFDKGSIEIGVSRKLQDGIKIAYQGTDLDMPDTLYEDDLDSGLQVFYGAGYSGNTIIDQLPVGGTQYHIDQIGHANLASGDYAIQAEQRITTAGKQLIQRYSGKMTLLYDREMLLDLSSILHSEVRYNKNMTSLQHQYENEIGLSVALSSGSNELPYHPELLLTNAQSAAIHTLKSATGNYVVTDIPDGQYNMTFVHDPSVAQQLVMPYKNKLTVKNGRLVALENKPPVSNGDNYTYMNPGGSVTYDITEEFSDPNDDTLFISSSDGAIVNGEFTYWDEVGKNKVITITADDGYGGVTSIKHEIFMTDYQGNEFVYSPIPEVDSFGASSWAVATVMEAISADIVPDNLMSQYQVFLNREEGAQLLVQLIESKRGRIVPSVRVSFRDSNNLSVRKAATLGIVQGNNGLFSPYRNISRQEFCVMLYNTLKVLKPDAVPQTVAPILFSDSKSIASWASAPVSWCAAKGIVVGSNNQFNPTGNITREQAVLMAVRFYKYIGK